MAVIATGFFDGVHIGHRLVIETLVNSARERNEESFILTLWPHPRAVLQNDAETLRLLNSMDEKVSLLKELGVDRVEVIPFTKAFSQLPATDFLENIVKKKYGGTAILMGYDNRIGGDALSTAQVAAKAAELGLEVIRTDKVSSVGIAVSSTKIRKALNEGRVSDAARQLCYRYFLHGAVVSGKQLGRTIGFPTANMQLYEPLKLIPARGVYVTQVECLGEKYYGMTNIGDIVETNIFDFSDMIYGLDIKVSFIDRVRDEQRFDTVGDLRKQLEADEAFCRNYIKTL